MSVVRNSEVTGFFIEVEFNDNYSDKDIKTFISEFKKVIKNSSLVKKLETKLDTDKYSLNFDIYPKYKVYSNIIGFDFDFTVYDYDTDDFTDYFDDDLQYICVDIIENVETMITKFNNVKDISVEPVRVNY